MRRLVASPRFLFLAGLALLVAAVALGLLLERGGRSHPRAGPPSSRKPQPRTTAPPGFTEVAAEASAFSATVTWRTPKPASGRLYWGPTGVVPALWSLAPTSSRAHRSALAGLAPNTGYRVEIEADGADGDVARAVLAFRTAPIPVHATAATGDGMLLVDGAPFFPLLSWEECPDRWGPEIAEGINLFAGDPCTQLSSLATAIRGRAVAAGTQDDPPVADTGAIGWFYPDEADGRGLSGRSLPPPPEPGVTFLTLTNHFYSGAAPLPAGRGIYAGLVAKADVVGFDLYPLQEWCRPDRLAEVFDAQQQLVRLASPRPTFQWIEVREMKCPGVPVTARTIRAESWLAIAGGARGLGFFPADWGTAVGATIRRIAGRIRQLEPALLRPALPVGVDPAATRVRASARALNGAVYVIAVNGGDTPARVTFTVPRLGDRTVQALGGQRRLRANGGSFTDRLAPLGVRVYVAAPQ